MKGQPFLVGPGLRARLLIKLPLTGGRTHTDIVRTVWSTSLRITLVLAAMNCQLLGSSSKDNSTYLGPEQGWGGEEAPTDDSPRSVSLPEPKIGQEDISFVKT